MGCACVKKANTTQGTSQRGENREIKQDKMLKVRYRIYPNKFVGEGYKMTPAFDLFCDRELLLAKREEFWNTRVDGIAEAWMYIKQAIEGDVDTGKTVLDAAGLVMPHNSITLSFDTIGYRYDVPVFCINDPETYVSEERNDSINSDHDVESMAVVIRSMQTQKDTKLATENMHTVRELKTAFLQALNNTNATADTVRFFYGGRELKDPHTLAHAKVEAGRVVQAFISQQ
mmetsp:Transcript_35944/g.40883  ORF Transcript_35944/g.40883 Transcript_35944/m.40883 type:complete len:230 (-) Transcript_35944:536-1225(-)|eukprot:CAMPEP_0115035266 /NCGR_PEP_ID=MMETSP0216-20121206/41315_1 /TAXON_ID=223996 /ORGANISM="Protocruzia adherens, Strain Boccale" /LENGTH=229 /DNA_ID=CAMNT_0002414651 /DNA_START=426 /DNA_END=1115 /DNA_ORIENTATION=-